jgi:glycosyltransferase involved in cell wall biosynthesis
LPESRISGRSGGIDARDFQRRRKLLQISETTPSEPTAIEQMNITFSVILTTYNWPEALRACLFSLWAQNDRQFEILIADDGSNQETASAIKTLMSASPIPVQHVFHDDHGFRAGTIRNKAVARSRGDYLLFLDGDCVVFPQFIARHRWLAETGYFVPGNRILLSARLTSMCLQNATPLHQYPFAYFFKQRLLGHVNRLLPLLYLPWLRFRYDKPKHWQNAMTCNLGVWKTDFIAVNGFDELFQGWGYEDSDLVIRLIHHGIQRKEGRFATPVLHLWHHPNDRSQHDDNYKRLIQRLETPDFIRCERGVNQYLPRGKSANIDPAFFSQGDA